MFLRIIDFEIALYFRLLQSIDLGTAEERGCIIVSALFCT